ncbi:MAG: AFG1/ZapE family ATPase [Pseudomonadota bacterium]
MRRSLQIAAPFVFFFIDAVPRFGPHNNNETKRVVTLIDAFYEAKTRLYLSAEGPADFLYTEDKGAFGFARTAPTSPTWPSNATGVPL